MKKVVKNQDDIESLFFNEMHEWTSALDRLTNKDDCLTLHKGNLINEEPVCNDDNLVNRFYAINTTTSFERFVILLFDLAEQEHVVNVYVGDKIEFQENSILIIHKEGNFSLISISKWTAK